MPTPKRASPRTPAERKAFQIFVSHISEEREVALALQRMLQEMFSGDVEVFTSSDSKSILPGSDWLQCIEGALAQADVVLVLCSRASVQRPWVQFELGAAWMRKLVIVPVCHSGMRAVDLPMPLSTRDAVEIDARGVAELYAAIAGSFTNRPADGQVLAKHLALLQVAESAFRAKPLVQYELALDIVLAPPGRLAQPAIPDDATVELGDETAALFGYKSGPLTWRQLRSAAEQASPDQRWMKQLETCVHLAGNDQRFQPVQAVYHCEQGAFQPQLSRREMQPTGVGRYHVHLVETVVARVSDVDNAFGLLATLLRLGLRFRYEVIERFGGQLAALPHLPPSDVPAETERVRTQMRQAIEAIQCDAKSRGAQNYGPPAVIMLFDDDADRALIGQSFVTWREAHANLVCADPEPDAATLRRVLATMRDMNFDFMRLATRRFHEMVEASWAPTPH
jgi:hypothetical protein